jgi:C4-dicarboxylate-specific signal transduction histidine kinase
VERIIRDSNRASDVIHNLRTLVKKVPPRQEPVALNDLIYRTLTLVNWELTQYQVEAQTELPLDLPDVLGDRVQLQQLLLNLILNAMEAMSSIAGRARVLTIRSEWREATETVAIAVRDSGVGLVSSTKERLLDAFFTTKPDGMGMGLSICRTIISAHSGRLSYANNADHGVTFEFTLPACEEAPQSVEIATA